MKLLLIASLFSLTAHAGIVGDPKPKITKYGKYEIVLAPDCQPIKWPNGKIGPEISCEEGSVTIKGPNGLNLTIGQRTYFSLFNGKISGDRFYQSKDEFLYAQDLKQGAVPQKVLDDGTQCREFMFVSNGKFIACLSPGADTLYLVDPLKKTKRVLRSYGAVESPGFYDLMGLGSDPNELWISEGFSGDVNPGPICIYDVIKDTHFCKDLTRVTLETYNTENGLLIFSTFPEGYGDPVDIKKLIKEKHQTALIAMQFPSMKEVYLAKEIANYFDSVFKGNSLVYKLKGNSHSISAKEILRLISEKGKVPETHRADVSK
jgi:hypothetical protein